MCTNNIMLVKLIVIKVKRIYTCLIRLNNMHKSARDDIPIYYIIVEEVLFPYYSVRRFTLFFKRRVPIGHKIL